MEELTIEDALGNSLLLESLGEAIKEMIDEFYIEKDIGMKIYQQACIITKELLVNNVDELPDVILCGKLKSYYCRNETWAFFVKNALFRISTKKKVKPSAKELKHIYPLNMKVYSNFKTRKEDFLKNSVAHDNIVELKNFNVMYATVLNKEVSTNVNESEDPTYYYDGLIKILCFEGITNS